MTIQKVTQLHSIEVLADGNLNVRWDTVITENGEVIAGPTIFRRSYTRSELSEVGSVIDTLVSNFQESPQ